MHKKQTTSIHQPPSNRTGSKASDSARTASEERLLNVDEVARILHVSRSMVYWLARGGDLPTIRIHSIMRFRASDVQRYIQKQSETSGQ
jgi:excisionase family DNA binding protein